LRAGCTPSTAGDPCGRAPHKDLPKANRPPLSSASRTRRMGRTTNASFRATFSGVASCMARVERRMAAMKIQQAWQRCRGGILETPHFPVGHFFEYGGFCRIPPRRCTRWIPSPGNTPGSTGREGEDNPPRSLTRGLSPPTGDGGISGRDPGGDSRGGGGPLKQGGIRKRPERHWIMRPAGWHIVPDSDRR
jgi:hypothetical protein